MCTTAPPVHIAVMGLERWWNGSKTMPPLLRLLTGSATGQLITTYFNMITSPRKPEEEGRPQGSPSGPARQRAYRNLGRSRTAADLEMHPLRHLPESLPVYTRLGGHAYGYVYPGPIGSILTPQLEGTGKRRRDGHRLHVLRACEEVCPVKIPIVDILRRLRTESYNQADSSNAVRVTAIKSTPWRI